MTSYKISSVDGNNDERFASRLDYRTLAYAITIVIGAFLLFLIQPLFTKFILPWFGGSAAVWSAALMFFQVTVVAGYGYAYWLTRKIPPNLQIVIHGSLLIASCALLPILPSANWAPIDMGDPVGRIVALLAANIGLPCFLLSSTSPLLQVWYVRQTGSRMPYRLFAYSNFGSFLALLGYPLVVEPYFESHTQAIGWSAFFVVFAGFSIVVGWLSGRAKCEGESSNPVIETGDAPTGRVKTLWVILSACASAMLMAITSHLSTNIAPVPLLWVMPLAVYLLTFILCFSSDYFYNHRTLVPWLASAIGWMAYANSTSGGNLHLQYAVPLYLIGLFLCCMLCHGELARRRPSAQYLAGFYFLVALGGAVGGIFVGFIAPNVFNTSLELPLLLFASAAISVALLWNDYETRRSRWPVRAILIASLSVLAIYLAYGEIAGRKGYLLLTRNFYGALAVKDEDIGTLSATRHLRHGTIIHGSQRLHGPDRLKPGSYYPPSSGVGVALTHIQSKGPVRYGVVGLGAGVLAGYARKGDYLRFYEINPRTQSIALELFGFVSHAKQARADVDILVGDGRLTLEMQPRQNFDLLVMDAFSSDAVPIHLLTEEAFTLYFEHLKTDGVLAVNVSNQYIDLVPVCVRGAEHVGRSAYVVESASGRAPDIHPSKWVLITSPAVLSQMKRHADADIQLASADEKYKSWTDRYSSVWPLLSLSY